MYNSTSLSLAEPVQQAVTKQGRRGTAIPAAQTPLYTSCVSSPDHRSRTPIIIVPSAATSLVTMYNVKGLLEDFK